MTKVLIENIGGSYTFDKDAGEVTLIGVPTLLIQQTLLITNVQAGKNQVIYQFDIPEKGGSIAANVITLAFDTSLMTNTDSLQVFVDVNSEDAGETVNIQGGTGNKVNVTSSGEMLTKPSAPTAPPGKTKIPIIDSQVVGVVAGNDNEYLYFTIPNGENVQLQLFLAGGEGESRSKVELYSDPLGADAAGDVIPVSWSLISIPIYISNNGNATLPLDEETIYPGDGVARIALRRKRLEASSREISTQYFGYY